MEELEPRIVEYKQGPESNGIAGQWLPLAAVEGKPVVVFYQDESTVMCTDMPSTGWQHPSGHGTSIKTKKRGQGIMISGYISAPGGVLRLTDEEFADAVRRGYDGPQDSTEFLEFGSGVWWTGDSQVLQVKNSVVPLVNWLFPSDKFQVVVVYDHSTCHSCYAPDALKAERMNVSDGGKKKPRPPNTSKTDWSRKPETDTVWALHSTTYDCKAADGSTVKKVQAMHLDNGTPKGIKTVLRERGDNMLGNKGELLLANCDLCGTQSGLYDGKPRSRCCLRRVMSLQSDFKNERPLVEKTLALAGIDCLFLPKFHCELNPIELVWAALKGKVRKLNDCTLPTLRDVLPKQWANIDKSLIRGCCTRVWRYNKAYRSGITGVLAQYAVKIFSSHRRIPDAVVAELERMVEARELSPQPTREELASVRKLVPLQQHKRLRTGQAEMIKGSGELPSLDAVLSSLEQNSVVQPGSAAAASASMSTPMSASAPTSAPTSTPASAPTSKPAIAATTKTQELLQQQ